MRVFFKLTTILTTIALLLTGCSDRLEIEKMAHVVVIGVDLEADKLFKVTFQIANPQVGSSERGQAQNEPPSDTISLIAPDVTSAKELANSVIPRKLNFAHLQTLIIGEKAARTPLLHHLISSQTGDPEMRREVNIIITKETAAEFIKKNKPKLETRPHKYYQFMQDRWKDTGHVPYATVNRYFQRLEGQVFLVIYATTERNEEDSKNEDAYLAGEVPQQGGDPVQVIGSAVIKNGKMIDTLTGEETRLALLLRRKQIAHSMIVAMPDPLKKEYQVSLRLLKHKNTRVNVNVKKDPPEVHVTVPLKAQVLSIPSLTDYVLNVEYQEKLKQSITKELEKKTMELIHKSQKKYKSETFLWHLEARKKFWTLDDYNQYNWEKKFTKARVQVDYDIVIESFGKQFKPPQIKKTIGE